MRRAAVIRPRERPSIRNGWRRLRGRLGEQSGFTIIELIVATGLAIVVFSATMVLLTNSMRAQTLQQSRVSQLQEAQIALQRLVRELREASSVSITSSTSMSYSIPVSGSTTSVTLSCSTTTGKCTRTAGSSTTTVVTDLTNSDVFTGSPSSSPTYVGIKLVISANNHTTVTLTDGAGLRNVVLGN